MPRDPRRLLPGSLKRRYKGKLEAAEARGVVSDSVHQVLSVADYPPPRLELRYRQSDVAQAVVPPLSGGKLQLLVGRSVEPLFPLTPFLH
jgi:hypothetical protein